MSVSKGMPAAAPDAVCRHLCVRGLHADGGLFALTPGLPEANEVHQLVYPRIEALLPFSRAPDLYTMLDKPLH